MAAIGGILVLVLLLVLVAPLVLYWLVTQKKGQSNVMDRRSGERAARKDTAGEDENDRSRDRERW